MKPLAIDLFCGLGGWTEGLIAEGYDVVGFDIERHQYGEHKYPAQLVLQDVLTINGRQFKDAALIVESPPCQEFSYMAMPWTRAKQKIRDYESGILDRKKLTELFDACFRIQREACEAAGRHIPLVVENVRGAQRWVGRARWNFGSFYLWGDVPALMPIAHRVAKVPGLNWTGYGNPDYKAPGFNTTADQLLREGIKNSGGSWFRVAHNKTKGRNPDGCNDPRYAKHSAHFTNPSEHGVKQGGDWFGDSAQGALRSFSSKSNARKAASAVIAKIPFALSSHIARSWKPQEIAA